MKWKTVCRWDANNRIYRLGRIVWDTGKLSFALSPRLFLFRRECDQVMLTLFGLRVQITRGGSGFV